MRDLVTLTPDPYLLLLGACCAMSCRCFHACRHLTDRALHFPPSYNLDRPYIPAVYGRIIL